MGRRTTGSHSLFAQAKIVSINAHYDAYRALPAASPKDAATVAAPEVLLRPAMSQASAIPAQLLLRPAHTRLTFRLIW